MLETAGSHIERLSDEDLRELVARLCEAELRRNGLPVSSVTAGGNQTAADGGVDVRAEPPSAAGLDFIPRTPTGFQVKCEDMPASKIDAEMRPGGKLRESIATLVAVGGAYIIASSQGSVSETPLRKRKAAMRAAIGDAPGAATAIVDFYDRTRLASWVREYPGVDLWMRERIGDPVSGWQGYGNWAGDKVEAPYLKDDSGRLISKTTGSPEAMTIERGLEILRARLRQPGEVVRLVGLSGVGKTRLVQALFEPDAAPEPLDRAIVAYTDQGRSPNPAAREMLQHLGANGQRAIVVVDNCNPATHRALVQIVTEFASTLNLVTVEYDVTDDEPEETHVFELTASSANVIDGILAKLTPELRQVDRLRIAEFSGGNARVALALARTVQKGETLGVLNDTELFGRLFLQNNEPDEALLRAAEACSLVYSFDGEEVDAPDAELRLLADIADLTPNELFRQLAELKRRDLLQRRGKWRAVLPHAMANRLARQALTKVPPSRVMSLFRTHERLLKSFSRRLGFLHDSPQACAIAERWLADEGFLARPSALNGLGLTLFLNLAPLVPLRALGTLEESVFGNDGASFVGPNWPSRDRWMSLARKLAYEAAQFERAARVVLKYVEAEGPNDRSTKDSWTGLFHIVLSGSLASPQQRVTLIARLLSSPTQRQGELACAALEAMLKSSHFSSSHDFDFGARPRGFGWEPKSEDDVKSWYGSVFGLVLEHSKPGSPYRKSLRTSVAAQLRALWSNTGMQADLAALLTQLAAEEAWPEGWAAVRIALRYDGKSMPATHLEMLRGLERVLRPVTLEQNVRTYVLLKPWSHFDIAEGEDDNDDAGEVGGGKNALERVAEKVEDFAREVAADENTLRVLLPELLAEGSGHQYAFGRGLAMAASDVAARWSMLRTAFAELTPSGRDIRLLSGFIEGARLVDNAATELILDSALVDPDLAEHLPHLQGDVTNDAEGRRLLRSLEHGVAPASRYWATFRRRGGCMSLEVYREVLLALAQAPDGFRVAIDSFGMELHVRRSEKSELEPGLLALGRELLCMFDFDVSGNNFEHHLNAIAAECLQGEDAADAAVKVCQRFAHALRDYRSGSDGLVKLASTLFKYQPEAALNAFLEEPPTELPFTLLSRFSLTRKSVVNAADNTALLNWVRADPAVRVRLLAAEIEILDSDSRSELRWSRLAAALLQMAANKQEVLDEYSARFRPRGWMGSLADALRPYRDFVERLTSDPDRVIARWAEKQLAAMERRIASDRRIDRQADESFE